LSNDFFPGGFHSKRQREEQRGIDYSDEENATGRIVAGGYLG
jgi:hypothetical protein